ncbi:MAG: cytochrome c oxidase assembly protein [Thermomicrobiaceae bacterium]
MASVALFSLLMMILHGFYDGPFVLAWSFDPLVTSGLLAAATAYAWAWRNVRASGGVQPPSWYAWAYGAGIGSLAFALLGPLETYNEQLFTLHMAQHLVIMQVATPLLLFGRPVQLILRALPPRNTRQTVGFLFGKGNVRYAVIAITGPVLAFLLFSLNLGLWHLPSFYDAALTNEWVHHLQHLLFAGFSVVYWWVIIDPVPRHHRLPEGWAIGSIFLSMMIGSGIGAILTLSGSVLYPFYDGVINPWGWSPLVDQQVGGLIMWVGSFLLYAGFAIWLAAKFLARDEQNADAAVSHAATAREQAAPSS